MEIRAMIEQDSDYALLTEIAVAYYDQEQTQEEIAKRFGISRIKVGRLLKKRAEGIVEISVKYHPVFSSQIEQQFISHFGIKRALIAWITMMKMNSASRWRPRSVTTLPGC